VETSLFPFPALTVYNISTAFVYNGHLTECERFGEISVSQHPSIWNKVEQQGNMCARHDQHLALLHNIVFGGKARRSAVTSSSASRSAALDELDAYEDPGFGFPLSLIRAARGWWPPIALTWAYGSRACCSPTTPRSCLHCMTSLCTTLACTWIV
jgi:hypothetical protein